jgi:hypothetical protein
MGLTRDQMMEAMELEKKQMALDEIVEAKCLTLLEEVRQMEGYGTKEYVYLLCCMVVCGSQAVGWENEDILRGVVSLMPNLYEDLKMKEADTLRN